MYLLTFIYIYCYFCSLSTISTSILCNTANKLSTQYLNYFPNNTDQFISPSIFQFFYKNISLLLMPNSVFTFTNLLFNIPSKVYIYEDSKFFQHSDQPVSSTNLNLN